MFIQLAIAQQNESGTGMHTEFERFVYLGQLHPYTFRNYFPNQVPTARKLLADMKAKESSSTTQSTRGSMTISIQQIDIAGDFATILLQVIDPSIPDHVVLDQSNGTKRKNLRKQTEAPIVSAHMVVNISSTHDKYCLYPTAIENNDFLPRSYIVDHLNAVAARHFTKLTAWISKGGQSDVKEWSPRVKFGASSKATLSSVLQSGGRLKGVKWVELEERDSTIGQKTYQEVERKDVYTSIGDRPTGHIAQQILRSVSERIPFQKAKKVSVLIEDENGKQKQVGIQSNSTDILAAVFIPQVRISMPPKQPLALYVDRIHSGYADLMKKKAT